MTAKSEEELIADFASEPTLGNTLELRQLLKRIRAAPMDGKYCLIAIEPHRSWQLARFSSVRGEPPKPVEGVRYHSLVDAEIDIFKRRIRGLNDLPGADAQ